MRWIQVYRLSPAKVGRAISRYDDETLTVVAFGRFTLIWGGRHA